MQSINAIYDGTGFKPTQPIPVSESYKVVITFIEPLIKAEKKHIPLAERLKNWKGVPSEPEAIVWGDPVGDEVW